MQEDTLTKDMFCDYMIAETTSLFKHLKTELQDAESNWNSMCKNYKAELEVPFLVLPA